MRAVAHPLLPAVLALALVGVPATLCAVSSGSAQERVHRPPDRSRTKAGRPATKRTKGRASRPRKRGPVVTPAYRRARARWHRPAPRGVTARWRSATPPPLVLLPVGQRDRYELVPGTDGRFDEAQVAIARAAFARRGSGETGAIHPRLLELVYRAVRHFDVPYVYVVSGFRGERATSRHSQGRAIDMVLPGVPDSRLAAFLRDQGFAGVGIYPVSGFVHLDVRSRSFFWVDRSGPGQRNRTRQHLRSQAYRADARARRRGEVAIEEVSETETEAEAESETESETAADTEIEAETENETEIEPSQ